MKMTKILVLYLVFLLIVNPSLQNGVEYNFEIKNGKNTLVVKKDSASKSNRHHSKMYNLKPRKSPKKHRKKKYSSENLSKMVKLGQLINQITDRLDKNSKRNISRKHKKKRSKKKSRKTFLDSAGGMAAMAGGAGALALGGGLMAGAADNDALQVQIDGLKVKHCVMTIKVDNAEHNNEVLSWSNRGFGVMKHRVGTLITNISQKLGIATDNVVSVLDMVDSIYDNVGQNGHKPVQKKK